MTCANCGKKKTMSCVKCELPLCGDCYHCGRAGLICGLCKDREDEARDAGHNPTPSGADLAEARRSPDGTAAAAHLRGTRTTDTGAP